MNHLLKSIGLCFLVVCILGATLPDCGGLTARDFTQVNVDGFCPADQEIDRNDYSYGMAYFKADDADEGHVYVGTGNNIAGLVAYYIRMGEEDLLGAPVRPPEIRRYRPDLGPLEWERVFDYRDVETDPDFRTIGFRFMTTLDIEDADGNATTHLYAATQGEQSVLWRSASGDYGDWEAVLALDSFGASVRWIEQMDGRVYLAVAYDSFGAEPPPGQVWASDDGVNFEPIMEDGFGDPNNRGVQALIEYNGWVYAGTMNDAAGFQIWKFRPNGNEPGGYEYVKVVENGGPSPRNENAGMPKVFKGKLYFGTQLYIGGFNPRTGNAFWGCNIIRIDKKDNWETIVGPDSLSGYDAGFNHFTNAYLWWMEEHDGWLYASTFNLGWALARIMEDPERVEELIEGIQKQSLTDNVFLQLLAMLDTETIHELTRAGGDIYKSFDGVSWQPVTTDGLGDPNNYGWRTMVSSPDGGLYVGSANPTSGTQVYRGQVSRSSWWRRN